MALGVDHSFNENWSSYWGDKTSTLDWCEENYLHSMYIAEFCKFRTIVPFSIISGCRELHFKFLFHVHRLERSVRRL